MGHRDKNREDIFRAKSKYYVTIFFPFYSKRADLYILRSRVRLAVVKRLCVGGHVAGETGNALGLSVGKSLGIRKEMEKMKMDLRLACCQEEKIRDLTHCHVDG
jgi:hypothetical protein